MHKHGLICLRAQPPHFGHKLLIEKALSLCESVTLVLGTAQEERTLKNPFTLAERIKMIRTIFKKDVLDYKLQVVPLPDIHNPPRWVEYVLSTISLYSENKEKVDLYLAGSEEDATLFKISGIPVFILNREKTNLKSGTKIRDLLLNKNDLWKKYIPEEIHKLIENILKEIWWKNENS